MPKPITNIVTTLKRISFNFNYKKCKTLEEIDKSLPTLIIGYNEAKQMINGFNILKKGYPEQKLWWTFSKMEKRTDYDKDIEEYYNVLINEMTKTVEYVLCDILTLSKEEKKKLWKYLSSNRNKLVYNHFNKFLFVYDKELNKVFGLSLSTCRYLGCDTNNLINKLKVIPNNRVISDFNSYPNEIKRKLQDNIHYMLPLYEYFSD